MVNVTGGYVSSARPIRAAAICLSTPCRPLERVESSALVIDDGETGFLSVGTAPVVSGQGGSNNDYRAGG